MPFMSALIGGGASLLSGAMAADSAGEAAALQAGATDRANAISEKQYAQTRSDQAPYRQMGAGASSKLSRLLGLDTNGGEMGREQYRQQLLPQYTRNTPAGPTSAGEPYYASTEAGGMWITPQNGTPQSSTVDEEGLNAAIERMMAQSQGAAASDPEFGSLLKDFSMADFQADPSYQFRKDEGMKGLERSAAARGGLLSGAALKGLDRFNSDLASQEYGNAFTRNSQQKAQKYNFLSGAVSTGQNAAAMTGNAGSNMANTVGSNTTALGNAQGAAQIAQGNAWSGAINNGVNGYQSNQLMNKILSGNSGWGGGSAGATRGYTVPDYPGAEY